MDLLQQVSTQWPFATLLLYFFHNEYENQVGLHIECDKTLEFFNDLDPSCINNQTLTQLLSKHSILGLEELQVSHT